MSETAPVFSKQILELIHYSGLFARLTLVLAILATLVGSLKLGFPGGLGAGAGSLLVLANVFLLRQAVIRARPGRLTRSIWWTVGNFYVAFVTTGLLCWLAVKFNIGHPLAFIGGLSIFFLSLVATLIWGGTQYLLKSSKAAQSLGLNSAVKPQLNAERPVDPPAETVAQPEPPANGSA
ncbi:MAG: hypothetical protein LBT38_06025 [Deltaproteobacteria bacterium]|jgi:hypothetical protein|nr:hypothetical protein [Deltaproteobacteria bacterium]